MAIQRQYQPLDITTTKSTAKASPLVTDGGVISSVLNSVEVRIPPGHGGLTGIAILWGGVPIVPWGPALTYIVGDDDYFTFDVDEQIGGTVTVQTYNTDAANDHSHYLRFNVTPFSLIVPAAVASVTPVPIA